LSNKNEADRQCGCGSNGAAAERTGPSEAEELVGQVRERYGKIANGPSGGCCGGTEVAVAGRIGYETSDLESVPRESNLGLGCGAPVRFLQPRSGETVLDLGSGAGLDALLAARAVGPQGKVIGVDMTPEMVRRASENARRAQVDQVEFRQGRLEALPVEDGSVDAVTSNCVINLVPDKTRVFREIARVLKPGGRLVVSDIVIEGELPEGVRRDLLAYVGCVSGALRREEYFDELRSAGFSDVDTLSDVDFLATVGEDLPEEAVELLQRTGVRPDEIHGKVRSVTYRARRD
jgi:SAM-dependent methyltransferase